MAVNGHGSGAFTGVAAFGWRPTSLNACNQRGQARGNAVVSVRQEQLHGDVDHEQTEEEQRHERTEPQTF